MTSYSVAVVQTENGPSDSWSRGPCWSGLNGVSLARKLRLGLEGFDR